MSSLQEVPRLLLMVDIESLDLGPRTVVSQIACLTYDLEEDEHFKDEFVEYLPVQTQLDLSPARTISFSTLWFWLQQPDEARLRFENNLGDDPFDLQYIMRQFGAYVNRVTKAGTIPYVICAKGPQFDLVAIETLLGELDIEVPWEYNRVEDLRTMLRQAKIDPRTVPKPDGFVEHVAYWDSLWQINQYLACVQGGVLSLETVHEVAPTGLPSQEPTLMGFPKTTG